MVARRLRWPVTPSGSAHRIWSGLETTGEAAYKPTAPNLTARLRRSAPGFPKFQDILGALFVPGFWVANLILWARYWQ